MQINFVRQLPHRNAFEKLIYMRFGRNGYDILYVSRPARQVEAGNEGLVSLNLFLGRARPLSTTEH